MANAIRPVSDLRNHFADISRTVHESGQPVFLTKNGYGDMVVMSMEAYESKRFRSEIYEKLLEAVTNAENGTEYYSQEEVNNNIREMLDV